MPHKTVRKIMQKYMAGFALLGGLAVFDGFAHVDAGISSEMMLAVFALMMLVCLKCMFVIVGKRQMKEEKRANRKR